MKACTYCRSLVPAVAGVVDEPDVYSVLHQPGEQTILTRECQTF
jgi:hypothetical protein